MTGIDARTRRALKSSPLNADLIAEKKFRVTDDDAGISRNDLRLLLSKKIDEARVRKRERERERVETTTRMPPRRMWKSRASVATALSTALRLYFAEILEEGW